MTQFRLLLLSALMALPALPLQAQLDATRLKTVLDSVYADPNQNWIAGIQAAVRYDGDSWFDATGWADSAQTQALTTDHCLRYYSVTKSFTAAMILNLVEQGALDLSDSLYQYVPITNPNIDTNVTVEQLLVHASGFPDYTYDPNVSLEVITNTMSGDTVYDPLAVMNDPLFVDQQLFPTGSDSAYSSTNYVLLGLIAEAVMADTAEQYFRNTFLTPAGLNSTIFPPAEPVNCNMPDAFDELSQYGLQNFSQWSNYVQPGELQQVPISLAGVASIAWTTGALVGKAEDIARWGEALYEAQVVSPAVRNQILASLDFQVTNGQAYGYGVFRDTYAGEHCVGHGGAAPGFRSVMVYDTLNNLAIGLMMNQGEGSPSRVANALRNEVLGLTDRDEQLGLQRGTAMSTAYPNPATEHISVDITALTARHLRLELLDMNGRLVRRALDEQLPAGQHTHLVDVSDMASGAYFLRLSGDDAYQVQKIVIQ